MATKTAIKNKEDTPSKPPPKYVTNLLDEMAKASGEVETLERKLKAAKSKRDTLVKRARDKNISYKDIAATTGMSISWINAALIRTDGYRPRQGRPRRRADVTDVET
jgi:hypothetical protein